MKLFVRSTLIVGLALSLTACGGDGSSSRQSSTTVSSTPTVLQPGTSYTLTASASVLVPSGTTISAPNGNTIIVNGTSNTVYVPVGSVITVPQSASGPANNIVSTGESTTSSGASIPTAAAKVTVVAGSTNMTTGPADGTGTAAEIFGTTSMVMDHSGNIIAADGGMLRRITPSGVVTTISPSNLPPMVGMALDQAGNVFTSTQSSTPATATSAEIWGASIYELTSSGEVKSIAQNWESSTNSMFGSGSLVINSHGNLYFADEPNNRIVKFTQDGIMSAFAGNGTIGSVDGKGTAATINSPWHMAVDSHDNILITDTSYGVRKIAPDGTVTTIAQLQNLGGPITTDTAGNIYVSAVTSNILRLDPAGGITSFQLPDGTPPIMAMVVDGNGNLYVCVRGMGGQILKISL